MSEETTELTALQRVFDTFSAAVRPPERLSYSQWAEKHFRLSSESSAQPGMFRPWKFQRLILDAIGDPTIERVTVQKSARTGFTKSLVASIGAFAANDPCPIILLMPRDEDARGIVIDEVDPAFRDSPALAGVMGTGRVEGRNTITQRTLLGGGSLKVLSANSPANLRRHTARVLFCDEVDAYPTSTEGDPIKLAEMRTLTYSDRKIVIGSTPTDEATSIVAKRYAMSDQRIFKVPCPSCGEKFQLLWPILQWEAGKPETAYAVCPVNGCVIEERYKPKMIEWGDYEITRPEVKGHAGFKVNALMSLFANASWGKLAAEYEQARKDGPSELQVFTNVTLGETWSAALDRVSDSALAGRAERFGIRYNHAKIAWETAIPPEVMYLTVGADVQIDRIEATILGWSADGQRWVMGHEVVRGSTKLETTWNDLDTLLLSRWKHPLGGEFGIEAACIDAGDGGRSQEVMDFAMPRSARNVVAIKGRQGPIPVIKASTTRRKRSRGGQLWIVGVDQVKTDIMTSVNFEPGTPNSFRFSDTLDGEWFRQLVSEQRKVRLRVGKPVIGFERLAGRAAEALDATAYAIAARHLCRFDFDRRELELAGKPKEKKSIAEISARLNGRMSR